MQNESQHTRFNICGFMRVGELVCASVCFNCRSAIVTGVVLIDMNGSASSAAASWSNGDLWQSNACETSHTTLVPVYMEICRYVYSFRNVVVSDVANPSFIPGGKRATNVLKLRR